MFWKKKSPKTKSYDSVNTIPIIKCSVCTGESMAGFKNIHTNKFEDVMIIKSNKDLKEFAKMYNLDENKIKKEY